MTNPEGILALSSTKEYSKKQYKSYGKEFFIEYIKCNPHSPYSANKASGGHFVHAFDDTDATKTKSNNIKPN